MIADEPTAALDTRAEHAVFGPLRGFAGTGGDGITVLVTPQASARTDGDSEHGIERDTVPA